MFLEQRLDVPLHEWNPWQVGHANRFGGLGRTHFFPTPRQQRFQKPDEEALQTCKDRVRNEVEPDTLGDGIGVEMAANGVTHLFFQVT